jgi:hypothetical protein
VHVFVGVDGLRAGGAPAAAAGPDTQNMVQLIRVHLYFPLILTLFGCVSLNQDAGKVNVLFTSLF